MKKIVSFMFSLFLVAGVLFVDAAAEVNININVPLPPPLEFAGPPDVVVVPSGTVDVYLVPNTVGLYFYGGYWYRFYGGFWFRASLYSGPWITIRETIVPQPVVVIPPDYILGMPPGYHRIHYGDFHTHWRDWGRTRHWHNQTWYRDHSQHHWGSRDFHKPPVAHGGDIHKPGDRGPGSAGKGPGVKPGDRGPGDKGPGVKPGDRRLVAKGPRDKSPGGAGPKVETGLAPRGRGPGGGKPGGPEPKGDHPAKHE